ncbi:MAG: thioredoxin family protein [Thermofilaceae archaeon]
MKKLMVLATVAFTLFFAFAQPKVSTFELESNIVATAFSDKTLVLAFANGSITAFSMPSFEPTSSVRLSYDTLPIGMGFLDDATLAVAFSNGTVIYLNPFTNSIIRREIAFDGDAYRAIIRGRWVVFIQKYNYRTEKGFVRLDRLLVYDTNLKAITLVRDLKNGRLVYVFDVKIVGNLMLLTWIDTTCEICKLDDTFVSLYDLTTYDYVFIQRFGECKIDADTRAMVAVRVADGQGLYYDLVNGQKSSFKVPGRPLDVRMSEGVGYVLTRDPSTGAVSLFRVHRDSVIRVIDPPKGERGYALLIFEREPAVAAPSFIIVKGLTFSVASYPIPWTPRVVAEGASWAVVLYGHSVLSLVRSETVDKSQVNVTIITEPYAFINIKERNLTVQVGNNGVAVLKLPPGTYTVAVWKEGFKRNHTSLVIGAVDERIVINLVPEEEREVETSLSLKGLLNITVFGIDGVAIEILDKEGRTVNSSTLKSLLLQLPPGEYRVVAHVKECSNSTSVTVLAGVTHNVLLSVGCSTVSPEQPDEERQVRTVNVSLIRSKLREYTQIEYDHARVRLSNLPSVIDINGKVIELNEGVRVLVFFYTKCTGCSLLIPKLKELNVEMIMLAPTTYDDEGSLRSYAAEVNATSWIWALDRNAELAALFNVSAFPTVVLLNSGYVEFVGVGVAGEVFYLAETFSERLMEILDALRDPAVIAIVAGFLLAYLGRGSGSGQREV